MPNTFEKPRQRSQRVVVLALVAVAGAGWWAGRAAGRGVAKANGDEASPAAAAGTDSQVADELTSLRRRLAKVEQSDHARGQQAGQALGADVDEAAREAKRKELAEKVKKYYTPEREAQLFGTYFGTLDVARRAEGADPAFGHHIEALTRAGIQSGGPGLASLSLTSVECGRTLCRMELGSSNSALKNAGLGELLQKVGPDLPQASVFVSQTGGQMTAYFARNGAELPPMPSAEEAVADLP